MTEPEARGTSPGDYAELALRELVDRYIALLLRGGDDSVTVQERARRALQQLAAGAAIAERVCSGWALDAAAAVESGACWAQVARARGQHDPAATRAEFAAWVRGQARLHRDTGLGLDERRAGSARQLLDPPGPPGRGTAGGMDGPGR